MRKIAILALCCLPLAAQAQTKVRLGGASVGAAYVRSPYIFPSYYPLFWDSWLYHPGFFYGFPYAQDKGEVKLQTAAKDAEVYIDGAYAGTAEKLKSLWLAPGAYTLALQAPGKPPAEKRIYVLTGKTLRIKL